VDLSFNEAQAVDTLMKLLAVEGTTGKEQAIGKALVEQLKEAGVAPRFIKFDTANERIPLPTQTGNLIVTLPGNAMKDRVLFMTHMDTVPLCAGAVPVKKGNKIVAQGETALGGDNRTGCAVLVTLLRTLLQSPHKYPPITLLFTVREESGLFGARYLVPAELSGPVMGFNVDGRAATDLTIGAVGAERWEVEILGKAAHAGVAPEKGISSTLVAALALAQVRKQGWFGKIVKGARTGTSNVGPFGGKEGRCAGDATNVVTDYVHIQGESRSHDAKFVKEIVKAYKDAFAAAAGQVTDDQGKKAKVKFTSRLDYYPFRLKETAPVVKAACARLTQAGLTPNCRISNGGLDANWINRHGIPTVTFGAGQNAIHTVEEWVDVPEFLQGCKVALALALGE
jgi:tripeptide aminopeptidase